MGCENSTSINPLPLSSNHNKISNIVPLHQHQATLQVPLQANKLVRFQHASIAPLPSSTLPKQQRQKSYIQQSTKKIAIEEVEDDESEREVKLDTKQLLKVLIRQLKGNDAYNQIVDVNYICSFLEEAQSIFINKHMTEDILQILISYIQQIHLSNTSDESLISFAHRLGHQLFHLKQSIPKYNTSCISLLQYLNPTAQAKLSESFLDFKFDLSTNELSKVINTVKSLLKHDERSAYYILLYLSISSSRLQKSFIPVQLIQVKMKSCIQLLLKSIIQIQNQTIFPLPSLPKQPYSKQMINFKDVTKQERAQHVESFIMECAQDSEKAYMNLRKLLWKAGHNWARGIEVSLFNRSDRAKVQAKRTIIDVQMDRINLEAASTQIEELTLQDLYFLQQMTYKEQLKEIFGFVDGSIEFKAFFLLQARLYFSHTTHMEQYMVSLRLHFEQEKYVIVEVVNKLNKQSEFSQILIKVSCDGVLAEIHLILLVNYNCQFYNAVVSSLVNNRNFTLCSNLKMLAESSLPQFLAEMKQLIWTNLNSKRGKESIQSISHKFSELQSLLPFSLSNIDIVNVNPLVLAEGARVLNEAEEGRDKMRDKKSSKLSKLARMMDLKRIMKDPSAESQSAQFYNSFQQNQLSIIELRLQHREKLQQADIDLLKGYATHIKQVGLGFLSKNLYEKAQAKFQIFIRIANHIGCGSMVAEGKHCLVLLQHKKGNFNRALQILERCFEIMENGSDIQKLPFLESMGRVYADQQKYETALQLYKRYLSIVGAVGEKRIRIVQMIGGLYEKMGEWGKTVQSYQECLQIEEEKSGFESYECAEYLIKISIALSKLGNSSGSMDQAQRCLKIIQKSKQQQTASQKQIRVRSHIAELQKESGDHKSAVESLLASLQIIEQTAGRLSSHYCETLQQLGTICELAQDYQESLSYYQQSLMVKQRIDSKNQSSHLELINRIAQIHQKLNNTAKCMKYQARINRIEAREKDTHSKDHASTFISIAKKSLERGNYPLSLKYFQKSLFIVQEAKGKDCAQSIPLLKSIGLVYKQQGHFEDSILFLNDSLTLLEKHKGKNNIEAAESYYQIGSIYDATNSLELAQTYYSAALQLCDKYNVKYLVYANANFGLANLYFRQQMHSKAFECYEHSLPLLEKLNPKQYLQAVQNMDACDRQIQQQFPGTAAEEEAESM